jgi:hypothetical protein
MLQRVAMLLGCVAAAAVMFVALSVAGFAPAPPSAPLAAVTDAVEPAAVAETTAPPAATPATQVDTVYVQPAATPKVVRIVRHAPAATPAPVRRVVVVARSQEESDDGEGESD